MNIIFQSVLTFALVLGTLTAAQAKTEAAQVWTTRADKSELLIEGKAALNFENGSPAAGTPIEIDPAKKYQSIDGFGFALTGGSAQWIVQMTPAARHDLLQELFSAKDGIGISYLRVSIGSSDLNARTFSYDDLPAGETDPEMKHFDLSDDKGNVIPVLQEILQINPKIKILGSPWSAPLWMKTNHNIQGGKLEEQFYGAYAKYFVEYIRHMKAAGITIDAITLQNEPFNDMNTPSMQFFAKEEARFIKNFVGPLFASNHIKTKIVLYDHNCDAPEYPISILTDGETARYVDGSGFHLYEGPVTAMSKVHAAFPTKNLYFTEMMATDGRGFDIVDPLSRILIGAMNNWSRNVILWNLGSDASFKPHTDNGGCAMCEGAIIIEGDRVTRNVAYYVIGHASKFVPMGSVRIGSTVDEKLPNVAFRTPEGKTVLIVANKSDDREAFNIKYKGKTIQSTLERGEAATFVW